MNQFSDAALLRGNFSKMLKDPPKEAEWKKAACDNGAEKAAQSIAKQIFAFQKSIDQAKEKLEVVTYSALGPIKVLGVLPLDGDLMRIDGVRPDNGMPVSMIQDSGQLSLTFTKAPALSENPAENPDDDDGMRIGFVIFDELKERKKSRDASKRKKPQRKPVSRKRQRKDD